MNESDTNRVAVVLSGGGAYGAYEVGVLKGLSSGLCPHVDCLPFDADVFAGTSAGAVNSAVFVSNLQHGPAVAAQYLEDFWLYRVAEGAGRCGNGVYRVRGGLFELLDPDCIRNPLAIGKDAFGDLLFFMQAFLSRGAQFFRSRESIPRLALETIDLGAFVAITRIREGLAEAISLDGIRNSGKELRVIATNFETGKLAIFNEHDIANRLGIEAVLASAAVPAFFPPVTIDGQLHIDGGTLLNTPLLREMADADVIHLVYMDPDIAAIPVERLRSTIDVLDRIIVINNAFKINQDLETLHHINESLALIESISGLHDVVDRKLESFLKAASRIYGRMQTSRPPYHKIAVHRYHPREDLGGALGFMNLGQQHVANLIERGYQDAIQHDCEASGCIIPEQHTELIATTQPKESTAW